jgi:hypothetical protein
MGSAVEVVDDASKHPDLFPMNLSAHVVVTWFRHGDTVYPCAVVVETEPTPEQQAKARLRRNVVAIAATTVRSGAP